MHPGLFKTQRTLIFENQIGLARESFAQERNTADPVPGQERPQIRPEIPSMTRDESSGEGVGWASNGSQPTVEFTRARASPVGGGRRFLCGERRGSCVPSILSSCDSRCPMLITDSTCGCPVVIITVSDTGWHAVDGPQHVLGSFCHSLCHGPPHFPSFISRSRPTSRIVYTCSAGGR